MVERKRLCVFACLLGVAVLACTVASCGDDAGAERDNATGFDEPIILSTQEAKLLLRQLPYRYKFRSVATPKGADSAVAGQAVGRYQTILNFGIALGYGHYGVPVPRAGTINAYGYPRGGFIFTDDEFIQDRKGRMVPNPQLHSAAQFDEASHMSVMMTDKLCLAATGEHCPP